MSVRTIVLLCIATLSFTACSGSEDKPDEQPVEQTTEAADNVEPETASSEPDTQEASEDEIPNAMATGTDIDNACKDLPGANFVSVQDMSGGDAVDRARMTFTEENYEWTYEGDVRSGVYDCEGGRITGYSDQGNQMRSGQYTPNNGRLQWRSMEFQMVSE